MLEKIYDNRVKLYALFLLALILALAVLCTIRATGFVIYEDGSWGFTVFQVKVTGCFPPMGCLVLDEVIPVDEEWLDHNEYTINGPLFQDNTLVISGWDYVVGDSTFWNCYHNLGVCILRHDDRSLFYRVLPDFPPPGWSLILGKSDC